MYKTETKQTHGIRKQYHAGRKVYAWMMDNSGTLDRLNCVRHIRRAMFADYKRNRDCFASHKAAWDFYSGNYMEIFPRAYL